MFWMTGGYVLVWLEVAKDWKFWVTWGLWGKREKEKEENFIQADYPPTCPSDKINTPPLPLPTPPGSPLHPSGLNIVTLFIHNTVCCIHYVCALFGSLAVDTTHSVMYLLYYFITCCSRASRFASNLHRF